MWDYIENTFEIRYRRRQWHPTPVLFYYFPLKAYLDPNVSHHPRNLFTSLTYFSFFNMVGHNVFLSISFLSSTIIHAQDIAILKKKNETQLFSCHSPPAASLSPSPFLQPNFLKINSQCFPCRHIRSNGLCAHAALKQMLSRPPVIAMIINQ